MRGGVLRIGDNVVIKSSFLSNLVGLYSRTIIVARTADAVIEIGEGTGISGATIYARKEIRIGNRCVIGGNVKILDNDFHSVDPIQREKNACANYGVASIHIGNNVFIGCNSLILKGVSIGEGSVVGAGSVVTQNVPSYTLVAGNPARVIRKLRETRD